MGMLASLFELSGGRCAACGGPPGPLCGRCARLLPAGPLVEPLPPLAASISPFWYAGPARDLVLALKLRGDVSCAEPLVDSLATAVRACGVSPGVVTWVPARTTDIARRGRDHAEVLGRGVASGLGIPAARLLARARRGVADQAGLDAATRRSNLEGAFRSKAAPGEVLLVDDLVTTGATARACAGALLAAGAGKVWLAAACRAEMLNPVNSGRASADLLSDFPGRIAIQSSPNPLTGTRYRFG